MNETLKIHKRKIIFGLIIVCLFAAFHLRNGSKKKAPKEAETTENVEKAPRKTSIIEYGVWNPSVYREVLGTVQSDNEVEVKAEVSGKIGKIYVNVGDSVRAGQALASYDLAGDATAINYQSALNNLSSARLSAENSVKSAETAVANAKRELAKTEIHQAQNRGQSDSTLQVGAKNAETVFAAALNFLDQMLGATPEYRKQVVFGQTQIGATNSILKNKTRFEVEKLIKDFEVLRTETAPTDKLFLKVFAEKRLNLAESIGRSLNSYDQLIVNTVISDIFSESNRASIQQQLNTQRSSVDREISNIKSLIEGTKTTGAGTDLNILSAQNRVKSAEEQLELTRSQAEAQIVSARNQVSLAGASQSDLTIRAPISGKLASRSLKIGDLLSPGQAVFLVVNEQGSKKVVAFLSQEEWFKVQLSDTIKIDIDGEYFEVTEKFLSPKIDSQTQKVLAEFVLPPGATLVGNLAKVLIPLGVVGEDASANLVPFSAVSFEPDGPEVLIINDENKAERKKVVVGKVVVSNVEIASGLETGTKVVEFYKRILPGEEVLIEKPIPEPVTEDPVVEDKDNNEA